MSDIFISYASEDKEKAGLLAKVLEQQGWSVWWDRNIPAGKIFADVIEKELDSSKCVVVLWSEFSIKKRWVKTEASEGASSEILVPVLIKEVKIPLEFRQIQTANLIDWQGQKTFPALDELIKDVESILGIPRKKLTDETLKRERKKSKAVDTKTKRESLTKKKTETKQFRQEEKPLINIVKFRSTPLRQYSVEAVTSMLIEKGFFDGTKNKSASGFSNDYYLGNGGKVVIDHASGLTWQQSGSDECIKYEEAKTYIKKLNSDQFAGCSDWRLPTLEEAMSLMEPTEKNDVLFIDPTFDKNQRNIWTSDLCYASRAWVVGFDGGGCGYTTFLNVYYVRAVRSGQ